MKIILHEQARGDVLEAFEEYEQRRTGLGKEFQQALDATLLRILRYPLAFEPGVRGLRRALVSRFPHATYFRIYPEAIVVVAVLHPERHPRPVKPR